MNEIIKVIDKKTKRCSRCEKIKSVSEFRNRKDTKDGLGYQCKKCLSKEGKQYCQENKEKIREYQKEYRKEHRKKNSEKVREYSKQWDKNNPEKRKEIRKRFYSIPKNRLSSNIKNRVYQSLKGNKKRNHWEDLVGFTLQDLMPHLEKQFKEGMTWQNMGLWHIDHIRPISSFNFISYEDKEFKECWALDNLQPLWAKDNRSKSSKIEEI